MGLRITPFLIFSLAIAACGPGPVAPPFLDVRGLPVEPRADRQAGIERLREAVEASGWSVTSPDSASVIRTAPREVSGGGLTRAVASLELIPLSRGFVRVYVHASRWNLLGVESKVYNLSSGLEREILGDLETALAERGFVVVEPSRQR